MKERKGRQKRRDEVTIGGDPSAMPRQPLNDVTEIPTASGDPQMIPMKTRSMDIVFKRRDRPTASNRSKRVATREQLTIPHPQEQVEQDTTPRSPPTSPPQELAAKELEQQAIVLPTPNSPQDPQQNTTEHDMVQAGESDGSDNDSGGNSEASAGSDNDSGGSEASGGSDDGLRKNDEAFDGNDENVENEKSTQERSDDDIPSENKLSTPPLLKSFQSHVAPFIWRGKERSVIKCHSHISKLLSWKVDTEDVNLRSFLKLIKKSKLLDLRYNSYKNQNKNLIAAFVERWHPETNSFHFPFGEMTITLDDVYCITGLSIDGKPVKTSREVHVKGSEDVSTLLGVDAKKVKDVVSGARGSSVKFEWLRETYKNKIGSEDEHERLYAARAYVLYTFGCTLFADKTGSRVSTSWLEFLEDMDKLHKYAWGAATLAYLYKQLGKASRFTCKQMTGYLTLLEAWIYEHFPTIVTTARDSDFKNGLPLSKRWALEGHCGPDIRRVKSYRELLDTLRATEVNWNPYGKIRDYYPLNPVTYFHGCISSGDIVEPYMPDRVLRQYGFVQTIPEKPLTACAPKGGLTSKKMTVVFGTLAQYFTSWDTHKLSEERLGVAAKLPWETDEKYMDWFIANSHLFLCNPSIHEVTTLTNSSNIDAWAMMSTAQNMMMKLVEQWKNGNTPPAEEAMQVMEAACRILEVPSNSGPSSSGLDGGSDKASERGRGMRRGNGKGRGRGRGRRGRGE